MPRAAGTLPGSDTGAPPQRQGQDPTAPVSRTDRKITASHTENIRTLRSCRQLGPEDLGVVNVVVIKLKSSVSRSRSLPKRPAAGQRLTSSRRDEDDGCGPPAPDVEFLASYVPGAVIVDVRQGKDSKTSR